MLRYLLLADLKGFLFTLFVYLRNAEIVRRCDSHDGTQRLHHGVVIHEMICVGAVGDLKSLAGFDNDLLTDFYLLVAGSEVVAFAPALEFYAYNFNQLFSSIPFTASRP